MPAVYRLGQAREQSLSQASSAGEGTHWPSMKESRVVSKFLHAQDTYYHHTDYQVRGKIGCGLGCDLGGT